MVVKELKKISKQVKPIQAEKKVDKGKKTEYLQAEKVKWSDMKTKLPHELIPTKRFEYVFGGIFLVVIVISLFQIPFGSLLSGDLNHTIGIGLPWHFFEISMSDPNHFPINWFNLIYDLLVYVGAAYAIDVTINVFFRRSSEEGKGYKKSKNEPAHEYDVKKDLEVKKKDNKALAEKDIKKPIVEKVKEVVEKEGI